MYVVVRAEPFTLITVDGTNPVPVKVMTADGVPASSVAEETEARAGAGLSTSSLTEPLTLLPFETTTESSAPFVSCAAGSAAVSCDALT